MSTLDITRGYADGDILLEADLDLIQTGITTLVNTTKLNDDNIQSQGITASSKLVDASIPTAKFPTDAITTAKLNTGAVTSAKISGSAAIASAKFQTDSVISGKIAAGAVTQGKIANDAVTTAKINDGELTQDKFAQALDTQAGGTSSTTSTSFVLVHSKTVTTTGRPVLIQFTPGSASSQCYSRPYVSGGTASEVAGEIQVLRGATNVGQFFIYVGHNSSDNVSTLLLSIPPGGFKIYDLPGSGSNTYYIYYRSTNASYTLRHYYMATAIYEL